MILHNYKTSAGKDLIFEYIDGLAEDEKADAFSVLECLENDKMNEVTFRRWEKLYIIMSFVQVNIEKEIDRRKKESESFARAWEESREEYRLINEMIHLRKQEKVTQNKLAELIGCKQQVISRVEKKENKPSLRLFTKMLDVLGYELMIVKKVK